VSASSAHTRFEFVHVRRWRVVQCFIKGIPGGVANLSQWRQMSSAVSKL